ncbi:hypothetical protein Ahy_A03g011839 [Arachis hypogaea]|uniref:K-box domain-containing protein n=1 Tax=Arachis hypogaea TaxID=3818 RepID=A0A445DRV9_ARAHY|nr:hypothetical protein Ahy_A03g011839 [Arachis hypogaea]
MKIKLRTPHPHPHPTSHSTIYISEEFGIHIRHSNCFGIGTLKSHTLTSLSSFIPATASTSLHSPIQKSDPPSAVLQVESGAASNYDMLRKKEEQKARELRQLNGEDLQGLTLNELNKLEEQLIKGLSNASKVKDELFTQEIYTLKRKGAVLTEENHKLKQISSSFANEQRSSFKSIVCNSSYLPEEDHGRDTNLKLGD